MRRVPMWLWATLYFAVAFSMLILAQPWSDAAVNSVVTAKLPYGPRTFWTPSTVCASGAVAGYTLRDGWWSQFDNVAFVHFDVQPSGAGTCSGLVSVPLPVTKLDPGAGNATHATFICYDDTNSMAVVGVMLATNLNLYKYDGTNVIAGDRMMCTGWVPTP